MPWLLLLLAGLFEVGWAVGLKYAAGFSRPLPCLLTGAAMLASIALLGLALKSLPLGSAYATWTGIGAIGTLLAGALLFGETLTPLRLLSLLLIAAGLVGLKLADG
jgi:quaternary ammonium compound-resistance protein SugE